MLIKNMKSLNFKIFVVPHIFSFNCLIFKSNRFTKKVKMLHYIFIFKLFNSYKKLTKYGFIMVFLQVKS